MPWQVIGDLFPDSPEDRVLKCYPEAVARVWPLSSRHKASLPYDIRDLSEILTSERSHLASHYWDKPRFVSAYLYYFLPWNLIRLGRLIRGLSLPEPKGRKAILMDCGSGPLTVPLALWLSKPQWRSLAVQVIALDAARQPLQLGVKLFGAMAEILKFPAWDLQTVTGSLQSLPAHASAAPWLITAANVLNELKQPIPQHGAEDSNRIEELLQSWESLWENGETELLFVEPGTRLGGKTIMNLRQAALELGLVPLAPCTHARACPLLGAGRTWCHFVFSAQDAPDWLKELSRKAGLFKTSLSLSVLLLGSQSQPFPDGGLPVRIISRSFPTGSTICRYGCYEKGLGLVEEAKDLVSGTLLLAGTDSRGRDKKSGARILAPLAGREERQPPDPRQKFPRRHKRFTRSRA